jgi:hypothetical protein
MHIFSSTIFYFVFLFGVILSNYFDVYLVFSGDYSIIMGRLFFWPIGLVWLRDDFISCNIFKEFSSMRLFFINRINISLSW